MNSYTLADISPGLTADFTLEVTTEKMALFYELTGDCSPIHMDEAYAQRRGYPGRVVYGMPVSYTHLDVYKRQFFSCASISSSVPCIPPVLSLIHI